MSSAPTSNSEAEAPTPAAPSSGDAPVAPPPTEPTLDPAAPLAEPSAAAEPPSSAAPSPAKPLLDPAAPPAEPSRATEPLFDPAAPAADPPPAAAELSPAAEPSPIDLPPAVESTPGEPPHTAEPSSVEPPPAAAAPPAEPPPPAAPPPGGTPPPKKPDHDPEDFRMTVGEHLEELRRRLFYGALGFFVAFVICMIIGEKVVYAFCRPLLIALARNKLEPHIYFTEAAEPFMTYIKISMISAATLAGPWLVYQIWQFVAAGLFPHEKKYVTKYLPLSILLLVSGMLFLYFYVLPLMLQFFIAFNIGGPLKMESIFDYPVTTTTQPVTLPMVKEDLVKPAPGTIWLNVTTGFIKIAVGNGEYRVLNFGSESVTTPMITLATYIDMVVEMLLAFGLSFQLPLVVLALNRIGILSIAALKSWRRVVYFSLTVVSAFVVPDVATGMVALLVPLILLYELGILLAGWGKKPDVEEGTPAV